MGPLRRLIIQRSQTDIDGGVRNNGPIAVNAEHMTTPTIEHVDMCGRRPPSRNEITHRAHPYDAAPLSCQRLPLRLSAALHLHIVYTQRSLSHLAASASSQP